GRPVRSKVARRIRANLEAAGAGFSPFSSSFARMKRSIGFCAQFWLRTDGTAGSLTGWNAQKPFSAAVNSLDWARTAGDGAPPDPGQIAPGFTQAIRSAISSSLSFPVGGIFRDSP